MDVSAPVKQHDQQGCHDQGDFDAALLDAFKVPEYAVYFKELQSIFQA